MDVLFIPTGGRPKFKIEVGYFETVKEIKENIQKYQGIPVSEIQTLVFNDKPLSDELAVLDSDITHRSKIQLIINNSSAITANPELPPKKTIKLLVRMPLSKFWEEMEFDIEDKIKNLKEKIKEQEKIESSCIYVFANESELQEDKSLGECELFDNSHVIISLSKKSESLALKADHNSEHVMVSGSKKLKVVVVVHGRSERIAVEVNGGDVVEELRKDLEKINKEILQLPEGGYFFIFKQNLMEEEQTFRWHEVGDGDTIEVFPGKLSAGKTSSSWKE